MFVASLGAQEMNRAWSQSLSFKSHSNPVSAMAKSDVCCEFGCS